MTEPTHIFDKNILKLSKSQNLQIAKTEWREIYREQRMEKTGLCICQHTLKNIIYMYNIFTNYTICVGTTCCKKFKLQMIKLDNNILENVIREMLIRGEYKIIDNILEYTKSIQSQLIKYIRNEYENNITNLEILNKLHTDINILIKNYTLEYLRDIYDEITAKIILEERNKFEIKEKKEKEEQKRNEVEKIKREEQRRNEVERIKREQQRETVKNLCGCGIMNENVCICKTPRYELVKLSNNLYCGMCNKWKCRC